MTAPRVAIDARPLSHPQAGGFRTYVRALLTGLSERAQSGEASETLLLYLDRPLPPEIEATLPPGAQTRVVGTSRLRADWDVFPRLLRADTPDLFLGTSNYLPRLPEGIVPVVTIHDAMGVASYPWDAGVRRNARERLINRYWAWQTRRSARTARLVLTVSHGAATALAAALEIVSERLRVVYNGVRIMPVAPIPTREWDTLLAIESPDPRKNVGVVYRALPRVEGTLGRAIRLRVVANGATAAERVRRHLKVGGAATRAEVSVGLSDEELAALYARSAVFAWPSHWEGFGLPPLEAMAQGCAVVSSTAPAMPEILGDAPLYADPDAPNAFAEHIVRLLRNPDERTARARQGRAHAATFTCRRMADETAAAWREALES